jgi:hypothetical protein
MNRTRDAQGLIVRSFELAPARDHPQLRDVYPKLREDDEIALITLDVQH